MKNLTGALLFTAALTASGAAFAQGAGCTVAAQPGGNVAPRTCGVGGAGEILAVEQPVTVIRGSAVLRLGAGSPLAAGDRILLRGAETATVSLGGSCTFTMASRATATLVSSAGRLCISQSLPVAGGPPPSTGGVGMGLSTPAIIGGGVVGAGAIAGALMLNRDESRRTISQPAVSGKVQ